MNNSLITKFVTADVERLQLSHLEAELTRIDILLRREVRRWVLAGQDPHDDYRGLYITQDEAVQLLERPFGISWGQLISLSVEEEQVYTDALQQATDRVTAAAQELTTESHQPRLAQLATAFGLDRTALDIFLLCLAPAVDTKYERLYGYLQDNVMRRRPSIRLLLDLLGKPGLERLLLAAALSEEAPLFRHGLLELVTEVQPHNAHWINQTVQVSEGVVAWLLGHYQPHDDLKGHATLTRPTSCRLDQLLVGNETLQRMQQIATWSPERQPCTQAPLVVFWGIDQRAQDAAVHWLATAWQTPLLTVALEQIVGERCTPLQAVRSALRDAQLTGALPVFTTWDVCLVQDEQVPLPLLSVLYEYPGPLLITGTRAWQPSGGNRQRPLFQIEFGMPAYAQRLALWSHFVKTVQPQIEPEQHDQLETVDLTALANQFGLTSGQIDDAVTAARDQAWQAGEAVMSHHFFATARAYSNPRLSTLARKVTPRYSWEQLVLPADELAKLSEIVAVVQHRHQVLEVMGVGRQLAPSSGVMALFAGPPGTGKTMAAEVMANTLHLDMYKIELSGVVSKYIGETEKNLERIFTEAANSNAILFFDEADALFGKRSEVKDAHDRYANIEVAYLLQRMELYEGITILATNLRANLDEAFARRFFRTVDFPFPKPTERLRIWQTLFPVELCKEDDVDFVLLAKRFDLAGGNIRNVIHSSAVSAAGDGGRVTMKHLFHGIRRELQKIGRLVNEEDFA